MGSYDHEEADTRLLIQLQDALQNGCTPCIVRTVDTKVVVVILSSPTHLVSRCECSGYLWYRQKFGLYKLLFCECHL